jgi:hypothetical protein
MLIFFDAAGTIHNDFVPPGLTVNAKFYCDVLQWLMENMRQKRPDKCRTNNWVLHHDNASPQTALASKIMTIVPRPFTPLILPSGTSSSSPRMKLKLKVGIFDTAEEIQAR